MTRRFFSGSTLDQAVMMAARHYGLDPKDLAYRQIEKRHGFLRTRKAVMIAVDPEQPGRQSTTPVVGDVAPAEPLAPSVIEPGRDLRPQPEARPEPHSEPKSEPEKEVEPETEPVAVGGPEPTGPVESAALTEPAPREHDEEDDQAYEDDEELLEAAERAAHILLRFAGIDAEASARTGSERVDVELEGPDSAVLVVENGTGLLAIQHLLPRMMRGLAGRSSFVRVDSEDFHGKRKERLQALALKEAEAVSRDGTPRTLPPMAPDERRLIHLAVQEIPTVVTESEGGGLHKRVVIRPVAADGGHDDIEARHGF